MVGHFVCVRACAWVRLCGPVPGEPKAGGEECRVVLPAFGAGPYLPGIVLERPVYLREMQDGLYGVGSYLTYKVHLLLACTSLFSLQMYHIAMGNLAPCSVVRIDLGCRAENLPPST